MKTIAGSFKYKCCRFRKENSEKFIIFLLHAWVRVQIVLSHFFLLKERQWYRNDKRCATLTYFQNSPDNEIYCDGLPESRNIGGCISDCFLDNGEPNIGNRRIAAVPIQRKRQHTSATELSDQVLSIQSAKRLFKGEFAEKRYRELERIGDQAVHGESSERTNQSAIN
jgi:hypothetical protein